MKVQMDINNGILFILSEHLNNMFIFQHANGHILLYCNEIQCFYGIMVSCLPEILKDLKHKLTYKEKLFEAVKRMSTAE